MAPIPHASSPQATPHTGGGLGMAWSDVFIDAWIADVPPIVLTTAQIEDDLRPLYRRLGFKPGWVQAVTGIDERRMWGPGDKHVDAGVRAARRALSLSGVDPAQVGVLVSCSVYRERLEPSVASQIQGHLGIGAQCMNFDVSNACLGFLTGMANAANMIQLGHIQAAVVVAAEDAGPVVRATIAKLCDPSATIHTFKEQLATLTLGSAATAAVLVHRRHARTGRRLLGGALRAATHHHDLCVGDADGMITDSVRLLREGVSLAGHTWADARGVLDWAAPDVRTFAMHQVGKAHHDTIVRHLGVPAEQAPQIYPWMGNVGACGVPVTAVLAGEQGHHTAGDRVALMGIGSGLNCAMMGVSW